MNKITLITLIVNITFMITFLFGVSLLFIKNTTPKIRADIATCNAFMLLLYCLCLLCFSISNAINGSYIHLAFLIFLIIPFWIGKIVQYKTLKLYSFVQFMFILLSAILLFKV